MRRYDSYLIKIINKESEDLQLVWLENNTIDGISEKQSKQIISKLKKRRDLASKVIKLEISFEETPDKIYVILNRLAIIGKLDSIYCDAIAVTKFCKAIFYPNETLIELMDGDVDKIINYINNDLITSNSIGLFPVSIKILEEI